MLKITADSHLDHGLTVAQLAWVLKQFTDRDGFFIETVELPEDLGTVACTLRGPLMGDKPLTEAEVFYAPRGERPYKSRQHKWPPRETRKLSVIAGPHNGDNCVLYTAFGGPVTPREPADIRRQLEELEAKRPALKFQGEEHDKLYAQIEDLRVKRAESDKFWSEHAL